ncbi:MAG: Pr6Pr family membrane protein [Cyclobacteriaceae bacterium]|nr:Pr6Pr family membrane protein [Cyclobacteriaceae bacterium]
MNRFTVKQIFQFTGLVCGGLAVVIQFCLMMATAAEKELSYFGETIRFFSYMTILTNILVALCFASFLYFKDSPMGKFFARPIVQVALFVYIFIVGATYHIVLAQMWTPTGLQFVVDLLLHTIVPIVYCLYWIIMAQKEHQSLTNVLVILLYPLGYFILILLKGLITGTYPYPFIDVSMIGYGMTFVNGLLLLVAYGALGFLMITLNNNVFHNEH